CMRRLGFALRLGGSLCNRAATPPNPLSCMRMRRVVCREFGNVDDLVIEDVEPMTAAPGQVVVDVRAAGGNFVDALFVRGSYQGKPPLPFVPGGEVAGVVSSVGEGVDGWSDGDRVIASSWLGAFASQVSVAPSALFALPDGVSFAVGASLPQSYATAVFS